jgi:hypothetical protein
VFQVVSQDSNVEKVKSTFFSKNVDERDGVRKFSMEKVDGKVASHNQEEVIAAT